MQIAMGPRRDGKKRGVDRSPARWLKSHFRGGESMSRYYTESSSPAPSVPDMTTGTKSLVPRARLEKKH
jgi:hypothetical protein